MDERTRQRRRRGRAREPAAPATRSADYRHLVSPLPLARGYSDDQIAQIHATALTVLQELGVRVNHDGARDLLARAGAAVTSHQVRFGCEMVEAAIASSPPEFTLSGGNGTLRIGGRNTQFVPVGGPPYAMDTARGKRSGTFEDFRNFVRLAQAFDVIHMTGPSVEPQDIAPALRHLWMMRVQMLDADKPTFVYARGAGQVADAFEILRVRHGLDEDAFRARPHTYTVINTNSPLILDIPMCQGLIDFAAAGQICIITPFTLSGAMAPVTIPGALVQQHAELLAGLVLTQTVRPGAPVVYGGFTSNVDMKSGAPAFGTPEYVRACWGTGQLARLVGLPWRSSASCVSNTPDAQAIWETQMSLWGALTGGANIVIHAAGWLEGGLSASYEKFILDIEQLQHMGGGDAAGALGRRRTRARGAARGRLRRALLRHGAHDEAVQDGLLRSLLSRTGRISVNGRRPAPAPPPSAHTISGNRCWRSSGPRRWIRARSRRSMPSLHGGSRKAAPIR